MITKFKTYDEYKKIFTYIYNSDEKSLKEYIDNGGNLKWKNENFVIYFTVSHSNFKILKIMLETNQFNINDLNTRQKNNGDTALIEAAKKQKVKSINLLLEYGADPNIQNYDGFTALMSAKSYRTMRNLAEVSDWTIKTELGYDVFDILPDWCERLSKDYPEKYHEYLKNKQLKKFKI